MKLSATIKRTSKGLNALKKRIHAINADSSYVKVGHLSNGRARADGLSNAEVGLINEIGSPENNIPARPWLRPPIRANRADYNKRISEALSEELRGKSALTKTLNLIGIKAVSDVKKYITAGDPIPPPNAPSTLQRKLAKGRKGAANSVRTLVDSAQMVNGISYAVVQGGTKKGARK